MSTKRRHLAWSLLLLTLLGGQATGSPQETRKQIEGALETALSRIGRQAPDLAVRDVRFWRESEARLRKRGRLTCATPGETDPLRPTLVDRALRSPAQALWMGVDAAEGRLPKALDWIRPPTSDPAPISIEAFAAELRALDEAVMALLPKLPEVDHLPTWALAGVDSEQVKRARAAFDTLGQADLMPLARRALRLAAQARRVTAGKDGWPKQVLRTPTPLGDLVIGTLGDDVYEDDAWLLVDPGGNDSYGNNAGGTRKGAATAALIDLAGNDHYETEAPVSQGAALAGIGLLIDLSGDDTFVAGDIAQGAALLGIGILLDDAGADSYAADRYAQGAGMFGLGALLAGGSDNDHYLLQQLGQGLGRTSGYGVLRDEGGDDRYEAGNKYESMYSKWTGGRKVHWSFAQGCGLGMYCRYNEQTGDGGSLLVTREMFPGGVGLLHDDAGNDVYVGSMYAQGTAYFYGLGLCVDRRGNDSYTATWYGQGAAPHFAVGVLADGAGNDTYRGMHQVQGNGRDFSTGVLVDLSGDDSYTAEDRVQGCGDLRDGYGIFLDARGDDQYEATRPSARGWATADKPEQQPTPERPYADVGIFLDLGGKDRYAGKAHGRDRTTWIDKRTGRGVGLDLEAPTQR
jgi:hypothetical protein